MPKPKPDYTRHRSDANEKPIVDALRATGATVLRIGRPADLLVGASIPIHCPKCSKNFHKAQNLLMEVKTATGKLSPEQQDFHLMWPGQITVVRSIREGLKELGINPNQFNAKMDESK